MILQSRDLPVNENVAVEPDTFVKVRVPSKLFIWGSLPGLGIHAPSYCILGSESSIVTIEP